MEPWVRGQIFIAHFLQYLDAVSFIVNWLQRRALYETCISIMRTGLGRKILNRLKDSFLSIKVGQQPSSKGILLSLQILLEDNIAVFDCRV